MGKRGETIRIISSRGVGRPDFTHSVVRVSIEVRRKQLFLFVGAVIFTEGAVGESFKFTTEFRAPEGYKVSGIMIKKIYASSSTSECFTTGIYDFSGNPIVKFNGCGTIDAESDVGFYYKRFEPPTDRAFLPFLLGAEWKYGHVGDIYIYAFGFMDYERE